MAGPAGGPGPTGPTGPTGAAGPNAGVTTLNLEFDESSGTTFADTSGYGNNASVLAGGVISGAGGHTSNAASFAGGAVIIPGPTKIPDSPQISIEAWIQPQVPLTGTQTVATRPGSYTLQQLNADVQFTVIPSATGSPCTATSTGGPLVAGNWHHVAGWYDGLKVTIALNGEVVGDQSCPNGPITATPSASFSIGAQVSGTTVSAAYSGRIDELRLRQLAAQQYSPARVPCPPGFADLGSFCFQKSSLTKQPYSTSLQTCYGAGRRLCSISEMTYACTQRATAGISFVEGDWNWVDSASYIYWSPGNYYQAHTIFRLLNGQCFGGTGTNPGQTNMSWEYSTGSPQVTRCCTSR